MSDIPTDLTGSPGEKLLRRRVIQALEAARTLDATMIAAEGQGDPGKPARRMASMAICAESGADIAATFEGISHGLGMIAAQVEGVRAGPAGPQPDFLAGFVAWVAIGHQDARGLTSSPGRRMQ